LLRLSDNEIEALQYDVAEGKVDQKDLAKVMNDTPIIIWGLAARAAATSTMRKASSNITKSIQDGNLSTSKWLITRNVMTEKERAMVDVLRTRAMNERLQILGRLKEYNVQAYTAALKSMGLHVEGGGGDLVKRLNAELRTKKALTNEAD
jgi:hypothetical protein